MTDEELDLLASSYLDGEATPDEVAMIERDPALLARIEELRVAQIALRAPVPAPSGQTKEAHLAAAFKAFDASAGAERRTTLMAVDPDIDDTDDADDTAVEPDTDPVIDLRARRNEQEQREAAAAGRMRWLSAVAGVLVFAAGAVFLVGQVGGGDDTELAGDVVSDEASTEAAGQGGDASAAEAAEPATAADDAADIDQADEAIESEAMPTDAEGDFALEVPEEAVEEAADAAEADGTDGDTAQAQGPVINGDLAEEGFFGDEPAATFATVPTSDDLLAELELPWRGLASARCADQAALPDGTEVIAYLPIEIPAGDGADDGSPRVVEALYLTAGNQSQVILVDPETCQGI